MSDARFGLTVLVVLVFWGRSWVCRGSGGSPPQTLEHGARPKQAPKRFSEGAEKTTDGSCVRFGRLSLLYVLSLRPVSMRNSPSIYVLRPAADVVHSRCFLSQSSILVSEGDDTPYADLPCTRNTNAVR